MHVLELGGTLFLPATHKHMQSVVNGTKYTKLKSVLLDTEDSLDNLESGLKALETMLKTYEKRNLLVFIRPRNVDVLKQILTYKNIEKIDGFILPKFSLNNAVAYLNTLENRAFKLMPSIEGSELFDVEQLRALKDILLPFKGDIPAVRFGLEDMLRQLKMKRSCEDSIFDYAVTSSVLGNFLGVFKGSGFDVSGGVYPCFNDSEGFLRDIRRDLKEGLFSKTIIHPNQIEPLNTLYKVKKSDYEGALEINTHTSSVFNQHETMAETSTMKPYAHNILLRAKLYGINE